MTYYIGLDAHASTSTAVVINESGKVVCRQTFTTSEKNLVGFLKRLEGKKKLTFEESHLSQWLYLIFKDRVDELIVCNPVYLAKKQGCKTDLRDAHHLARELRGGHLVGVYHDSSHWTRLRVLVSGYMDIVGEIAKSKCRLKALFRSEAIDTSATQFYKMRERTDELSHDQARFVAENFFDQIEYLERQKLQYKDWLRKNSKKYRPIRNLKTIPGINDIRANIIAAVVCMPHRFKSKHQFWGYCMLVRHIESSGGKIYGNKKINGRAELKAIFLGAAENALRGCSSLRDYYDAQRARGVKHRQAKIALA